MKQYILSLMRDERRGIIHFPVKVILFLLSLLYLVIIKIWGFCYDKGILRKHKVKAKVISVGSITLGGAGKTPFVLFLAKLLKAQNKDVSVLIRGYGDDEWRMLEKNLGSVYVIKGRDRLKSARQSGGMHPSKIFILDDGFQHRRLKRDLDIVLVDSHDGFGNGRIFPSGTLREPPSAIKRADVVVLTKSDFGKDNVRNLRIILSGKFKKHKSLEAIYKPSWLYSLRDGSRKEIDAIRSKKVSLVSAVANPAYFKYMVNNLGAEIIHKMDFPDHHNYTQKDFERIEKTAIEQGCEYVVVTEKDMVKLAKLDIKNLKLEILVLHVELEITKGMEELVAGLNSMLSS